MAADTLPKRQSSRFQKPTEVGGAFNRWVAGHHVADFLAARARKRSIPMGIGKRSARYLPGPCIKGDGAHLFDATWRGRRGDG